MNRNIESRTEGLHRSPANVSACHVPAVIATVLLVVTLMAVLGPSLSFAEEALPAAVVSYRDGKITGVYETTFQIDHRTYSLTPDAVILDDTGNQLDAGMLAANIEVKYHVKKDQNDKIDRMIVFLPR